MKQILSTIALAAVMASCTSTPNNSAVITPATPDTAGFAQFQAYQRQQQLLRIQENNIPVAAPAAVAPVAAAPVRSTRPRTYSAQPAYDESGSISSTSGNTAKAKQGWSKAAKGAVIGAGAGAVAGAVINKRNRTVGGVIGGVAGGAIGYGIGRAKDKKDGRY